MKEVPEQRIVVTGSVAFDYLMTFPGEFMDVMVPDKMHRLSVSFLVDSMRRVRGGIGPNIAYGLALLGLRPTLLATAGPDAVDYKSWLESEGVDVSGLKICDDVFTASFFVSTDLKQNQIASFYAGAMARAAEVRISDLKDSAVGLVLISPNDPGAMAAYAKECRALSIPFVYDPSQQVARLSGEELTAGLEGASILIGNEYEFGIIEKKTNLNELEILARVPIVIITRGEEGATITLRGGTPDALGGAVTFQIPPARLRSEALDPTGVGDAFRAGLFAARARGVSWPAAGRVGAVAAVYALETLGPQPKRYSIDEFLVRYAENFGTEGDDGEAGKLRGL